MISWYIIILLSVEQYGISSLICFLWEFSFNSYIIIQIAAFGESERVRFYKYFSWTQLPAFSHAPVTYKQREVSAASTGQRGVIRGPWLSSTSWLRDSPKEEWCYSALWFSGMFWVITLHKVTQVSTEPSLWPLVLTRMRLKNHF